MIVLDGGLAGPASDDRPLAIRGRVFDGRREPIEDGLVVVRGGRIEAVGAAAALAIPFDARVIEAPGHTVLPGLIDAHVHLSADAESSLETMILKNNVAAEALLAAAMAARTLAAGFTTVRDTGSWRWVGIGLRQALQRGHARGPRLLAAGAPLAMTGGHSDLKLCPHVHLEHDGIVDGVDEARRAVRRQLKHGVDLIKVHATGGILSETGAPGTPQLSPDELRVIVDEAHRAGRRVAAHAMGAEGVKQALAAGVDTIEHGCLLDEEALHQLVARRAFLVPTLIAPVRVAAGDRLPPWAVEKARAILPRHRESVRRAREAGVRITLGTDAGTPFNRHGDNAVELQLLVEAGLTPLEALTAATATAAAALGVERDRGTLEPGLRADLLLVDGDPTTDVTALQRRAALAVFLDGRLVSRGGTLVETPVA